MNLAVASTLVGELVTASAVDVAAVRSGMNAISGLSLGTADDVDVAVIALRQALAKKACLIVADDCWDATLLQYLLRAVGAPECTSCCLFISTRQTDVARLASSEMRVMFRPMAGKLQDDVLLSYAKSDGLSLPSPQGEDMKHMQRLLEAAAGLPMALALLGSLVRQKVWADAAPNLSQAVRTGPCPS